MGAGPAQARVAGAAVALVVDRAARAGLRGVDVARLRRRVARMVAAAARSERAPRALELTLRLTGDAAIRRLNREYRDADRATDVLAFAQREGKGGRLHPHLLGDVVISVPTAARQASRSLPRELLFLAAHGLCHLLGYDHRTDAEEAEMNRRMRRLMAEAARTGPVRPA